MPTDQEIDLATRVALAEASGQPDAGIAGVFHVMKNRLAQPKRFGGDMRSMINGGGFEGYNSPSPAQSQLLNISRNNPQYQHVRAIAEQVFNGTIPDMTYGSTHFLNPELQASGWAGRPGLPQPSWSKTANRERIGAHVFPGGRGGPTDEEFDKWAGPDVTSKTSKSGGPAPPMPEQGPTDEEFDKWAGLTPSLPSMATQQAAWKQKGADQPISWPTPLGKALQGSPSDSPTATFAKAGSTYLADVLSGLVGIPGGARDLVKAGAAGIQHLKTGEPFESAYGGLKGPAWLEALHSPASVRETLLGTGGGYTPTSEPGKALASTGAPVGSVVGFGGGPFEALGAGLGAGTASGLEQGGVPPWLAAAGGLTLPMLLSRGMGQGMKQPNPVLRSRFADALGNEGIPYDAADIVGARSFLARKFPGAAGMNESSEAAKDAAWTKAVLAKTGGDEHGNLPAWPEKDFIVGADKRTGKMIDDIESRTLIPLSTPFPQTGTTFQGELNRLRANTYNLPMVTNAQGNLVQNPITRVLDQIDSLAARNGGQLPGNSWGDLMNWSGSLGRLSMKGSPEANYGRQLRQLLQQAFENSAPAADVQAYNQAKSQWAATRAIEPAIKKGVPGELTPEAIKNGMNNFMPNDWAPENMTGLDNLIQLTKAPQPQPGSALPAGQKAANWLTGAGGVGAGAAGGYGASSLFSEAPSMTDPATLALAATGGAVGLGGSSMLGLMARRYGNNPQVINELLSTGRIPGLPARGAAYGLLGQDYGQGQQPTGQ